MRSIILGIVVRKCMMFVPMDCWFVAFETVGYKIMHVQKILFCYINLLQIYYEYSEKSIVRLH
jgi:hypothetical protein